jgi:hypothetical protein
MKFRLIAVAMIFSLLTACTSRTQYGECIGAFEEGKKDLYYKPSVLNIVLAVLFVETIIVPVFVIVDQTKCPEGKV